MRTLNKLLDIHNMSKVSKPFHKTINLCFNNTQPRVKTQLSECH